MLRNLGSPAAAQRYRQRCASSESATRHMQIFVGRCQDDVYAGGVNGDELLKVLATLANPHRLRVVAALTDERNYVSALARDLGISRALLQVHLRKLESAGLVKSSVEVSDDGKAMKFYEVAPFALYLTPDVVAAAARTLTRAATVQTRTSQAAATLVKHGGGIAMNAGPAKVAIISVAAVSRSGCSSSLLPAGRTVAARSSGSRSSPYRSRGCLVFPVPDRQEAGPSPGQWGRALPCAR